MRAREFVMERRQGRLRGVARQAMPGSYRFRDSGIDRAYNLNRVMMAAACANGQDTRPVDMPESSWSDRYNTAHPYTDVEHRMLQQAFGTVATDYDHNVPDHHSREHAAVNTTSPVRAFQGYTK